MDYKYIEQLLERYWECQTTLEEEAILRSFFSQEDIPASLIAYRSLFAYQKEQPQKDVLGSDFDKRMLELMNEKTEPKVVSFSQRLRPLYRAAAVVAILLTLGNAVQKSSDRIAEDYNQEASVEVENPDAVNMAKMDSLKQDSLHRRGMTSQK